MAGLSGDRLSGTAYGLAAALAWGGFPVVTRLSVGYSALDMYDVTFLRFAVSAIILLPVLLRGGFAGISPLAIAVLVIGIGPPYMLAVSGGLELAPVGLFAVLTPGSMILFSVILSAVWLKTRPSGRDWLGIAVILAGIVLAGLHDLKGVSENGAATALLVLGGFLWALYTVSTRHFAIGALRATAFVSAVSALLYAPVYFSMKGTAILAAPVGEIAIQAVYQGVLLSAVALFFFNRSVALLGSTTGASFAALVPGLAVVEAFTFLGEQPTTIAVAGLAIVTAGMGIILVRPRQKAIREPQAQRTAEA